MPVVRKNGQAGGRSVYGPVITKFFSDGKFTTSFYPWCSAARARKACKSRAEGECFTSFSRVLTTSRVGYHAGKPIESVVCWLNVQTRTQVP